MEKNLVEQSHHPIVSIYLLSLWEAMNSSPGLLAITGGCVLWAVLSGLFTYMLIEFVEIGMNATPDYDMVEIDDFMTWWANFKAAGLNV